MALALDIRRPFRALRKLIHRQQSELDPSQPSKSLSSRLLEVFLRTWDLGFTAFGGPPVHFNIIHCRFVEGQGGEKWIDKQTYQELFAVCQGLPGPASTKMLFCITLLHAGFIPALLVFFLWSFPGAIAMYTLSLGVARTPTVLPSPVYALLSGLNASTVGIIALAAVQLAEKAITDDVTRVLVIFGACAGVCYNALWYFPVLMVVGATVTFVWDGYAKSWIGRIRANRMRRRNPARAAEEMTDDGIALEEIAGSPSVVQRRTNASSSSKPPAETEPNISTSPANGLPEAPPSQDHTIRLRVGILIVLAFFASFTAIILIRALLRPLPIALSLFSNMYLAGTIIFGGGPVVIPLLRSYVVDPGFVTSRDFLLGLAVIQALPGPNFNFAVYLGALALQHSSYPSILGSFIAFIGVFTPGLTLAVAVQGFWRVLRKNKGVVDALRGVNATAVGLVFTAVYRLWEIGYLTPEKSSGLSLATRPWWVVVAAVAYAESAWFGIPPPVAIVIGAVLGLGWWGAVGR